MIRVGGVPEHFNYPWFIAEERGIFAKHGVQVGAVGERGVGGTRVWLHAILTASPPHRSSLSR